MTDEQRARLDELLAAVCERRMSVSHALAQAEEAGIVEPAPPADHAELEPDAELEQAAAPAAE